MSLDPNLIGGIVGGISIGWFGTKKIMSTMDDHDKKIETNSDGIQNNKIEIVETKGMVNNTAEVLKTTVETLNTMHIQNIERDKLTAEHDIKIKNMEREIFKNV